MRDGAGREIVDAGLRDRRSSLQRDPARGFKYQPARDHLDRRAHVLGAHVVEQRDIGAACLEHLAQLIERIDLDFDLHQMPGDSLRAGEHGRDAARDCDVVVLDQNRVVETEAVIEAAAATHRIFLQRAQPRRGLAGAANPRACVSDQLYEGRRLGRDAGQVAEEIERGALGGEQGARIRLDGHQLGLGFNGGAVALVRGD